MPYRMGELAAQDDPFPRANGRALLANAMYEAIDPAEGDFYRGAMYNTARAAEGIRQYAGDRPASPADPNVVDWSRMNQPLGTLTDTNPVQYRTPSGVEIRPSDINQAIDIGMGVSGGGLGIKAYHGSPYSFDRFDLSKIGTGEGAQSYGHGLYFAENEGVARSYRDKLGGFSTTVGQQPISWAGDIQQALPDISNMGAVSASQALKAVASGGNLDAIIARKEALLPKFAPHEIPIEQDALRALKWARDTGLVNTPKGHMYKVDINADPAHFLDWDKPLSGQRAREALVDRYPKLDYSAKDADSGQQAYEALKNLFPDRDARGFSLSGGRASPEGASRALREAGIPGIKYLDQGSRVPTEYVPFVDAKGRHSVLRTDGATGRDTVTLHSSAEEAKAYADANKVIPSSNYVVFNPAIIDIMKKYGIAAPIGGMGALAAQDDYR